MQREIELLMMAMEQRHQREIALLERIMSSIAKDNEAHNQMAAGISEALAEHETTLQQNSKLCRELEGEIESVIHYIRKDTAREQYVGLKGAATCNF